MISLLSWLLQGVLNSSMLPHLLPVFCPVSHPSWNSFGPALSLPFIFSSVPHDACSQSRWASCVWWKYRKWLVYSFLELVIEHIACYWNILRFCRESCVVFPWMAKWIFSGNCPGMQSLGENVSNTGSSDKCGRRTSVLKSDVCNYVNHFNSPSYLH